MLLRYYHQRDHQRAWTHKLGTNIPIWFNICCRHLAPYLHLIWLSVSCESACHSFSGYVASDVTLVCRYCIYRFSNLKHCDLESSDIFCWLLSCEPFISLSGSDACKGSSGLIDCGYGDCRVDCHGRTDCEDLEIRPGAAKSFICYGFCPANRPRDYTNAPTRSPTQFSIVWAESRNHYHLSFALYLEHLT